MVGGRVGGGYCAGDGGGGVCMLRMYDRERSHAPVGFFCRPAQMRKGLRTDYDLGVAPQTISVQPCNQHCLAIQVDLDFVLWVCLHGEFILLELMFGHCLETPP